MSLRSTLALAAVLGIALTAHHLSSEEESGPAQDAVAAAATATDAGDPWSALRPSGRAPQYLMPPPTEHWLGEGAENRNKKKRKAWFREIHKTAPDTDYKAVEKANGLAQIAKRNRIAEARAAREVVPRSGVWVERGSSNQAGRMHVALHSPDDVTLWAGSAKGGIWRRPVDEPTTPWVAIGDNLYGGAHHLLILEGVGGPDIVVAATDGGLIHRSADDGASWQEPQGLPGRWAVRRLLQTGGGIFVVVEESNWGGFSVWRSTNNAGSFEQIRDLDDYRGDLWSPRDGTDDLYLVDEGDLYTSTDHGDSWTLTGSIGGGDRGELTGSEAGAPTLYAVLNGDTLHRSDDAGTTWTEKHPVTDYWGSLNASIQDDDLFAWGGVEVHRTFNGGDDFDIVNGWGAYYDDPANRLHADIPGIDVLLDDAGNELWYISTDGGLYHSTDGLQSVENLSLDGLRVSQYYSTLTSSANPDHIAAGAQDQGYQVSYVVDDGLVQFDQIISGDYGHLTSGDGTHAFVFSCYPGFVLAQIGEDSPQLAFIDFPEDEESAWLPPMRADPENRENFFFAATHLYYYTHTPGTDEWTPQRWSEQDFDQAGGEYISAIHFSPLNPDRAYLATNEGRIFHSNDKGVTWTRSTTTGPGPHYFYGHAMVASRLDVDTVYVGGSGYNGPAVWRSTDGGATFEPWGEGLPATLVYSMAEASGGEMFAGTETAAYRRDADAETWVDITEDTAPVTIYWSVEILPDAPVARFGTYGRGIWDHTFDPGCIAGVDQDDDGFDCTVDCDDSDPAVNPDAFEVCDGIDTDCDPENPAEADIDGDGVLGCDGDCDDERASVYPGADETCDGRDEDCDGLIDNDPIDTTVFHVDADGDGFGDLDAIEEACEEGPGLVRDIRDCDDSDPDVNPDAEEVCGNGKDDDCEGGDARCTDEDGDGGDGCTDCGASVTAAEASLWGLLLIPAAVRRRR